MRVLEWRERLLIGLAVASLQGRTGNAQILSNATCLSSFDWAINSLNQSPCLVAAYLQGACFAGVWTTPALPHLANGTELAYNPPDGSTRNVCTCSWAVYNLLSACAACQDGAWREWPAWATYCETATDNLIANQAFPPQVPVPPGTAIPEYAAKDPSTWTDETFNVTEAKVIGSHNIETTSSSSSPPSSSTANATVATTSPVSAQAGPEVGPIVGGVVGGVLGLLLIAILATFLLCPSWFRCGPDPSDGYPPTRLENKPADLAFQSQIGGVGTQYGPSIVVPTSHQGLLAPHSMRPPLVPQFTSSVHSFGTSANQSTASSTAPQVGQHASTPQIPQYQPLQESIIRSTPSPPNTGAPSFMPNTTTGTREVPSVRAFFTRVVPRQRHAHTLSDTSITSASSLLPRIQQSLWGQHPRNDVVVPYTAPDSASTSPKAPPQHRYPANKKGKLTGPQYPPPRESQTLSHLGESSMSEGSTIGMEHALLRQNGFLSMPEPPETMYGGLSPGLVLDARLEADRQTNMSPANASSILEAAPPYVSEEHRDLGGRGMALRRTPRLPDVDEYPEEKARFTNAAAAERPAM